MSGYQSGGHYYVCNTPSRCWEVSQNAWEWSRAAGLTQRFTFPVGMLGSAFIFVFVFLAKADGTVTSEAAGERARSIRNSGPALASGRCAGRIGGVLFKGPLLGATVYPEGLVIRPGFVGEYAILASEISRVTTKEGVFGVRLEVEHAGVGSGSPLVLYGPRGRALAAAVRRVAGLQGDPADETRELGLMVFVEVLGVFAGAVLVVTQTLFMLYPVWVVMTIYCAVSLVRRLHLRLGRQSRHGDQP